MLKISVLPGDGIGPEVTDVAVNAAKFLLGDKIDIISFPDLTTKNWVESRNDLDESKMNKILSTDAIFLGAVGDDLDIDFAARVLLRLRFELDLYVNLRPCICRVPDLSPLKKSEDIDLLIVRENTEGFYRQIGGWENKGLENEMAWQRGEYTRKGTERIIRYAFELAKKDSRDRVTMVDKSNVLRHGHQLWLDVFNEISEDYPEIEADHLYVDACSMQLVKRPESFGVLVSTNMFGDIISDIGAQIVGGLGLAESGNIHPGKISLFEPVHGSAPKYAGKNVANPFAAVLSMALLLKNNNKTKEGLILDRAVTEMLKEKKCTSDLGGNLGTSEVNSELMAKLNCLTS
ncbi:3-isopropylmalate dehydrogenase [bacterium]|nr:3-isopropylmalate dehydrogenase [bacterium]|tara:strand:- start:5597 stop:6637 length:1041 start_codon:yes stop_codon:yes gene_type:complete